MFKDENKPAIYFKIWFLSRSKHTPSLVKINQLMLFGKTVVFF